MAKMNLTVSASERSEHPSLELALKVPLQQGHPQVLTELFCLMPKSMFPLLRRFLSRSNLSFKVAALKLNQAEVKYLLLLSNSDRDGTLEPIPEFILAYINNLPYCHLFQGFGEN